jgi:hypothetical protein
MDFIPKPPETPMDAVSKPVVSASNPASPQPVSVASDIRLEKGGSRFGLTSILVLLVLVALIIFSILTFFSNRSISAELESTQARIAQIDSSSSDNLSKASLSTKKQFFDSKMENRLVAYNLLTRIFEVNGSAGNSEEASDLVRISSISGNKLGEVTVNIQTDLDSTDPYIDTALLIREFKRKAYFENVFIPNIGSSLTQLGQDLLNYSLRATYKTKSDPVEGFIDVGFSENNQEAVDTVDTIDTVVDDVRNDLIENLTTNE